jgi:exopolyphosphatase/guanosine-5'-triphosphate,3'-diphosphate pyrophosphatase
VRRAAAVDVGSNTVRLLVGVTDDGGDLRVVGRDQVITRLGEGMGSSLVLTPDAIRRTVLVLSRFRERWEKLGAERYRAVATSAVREADNKHDFVEAARAQGVTVEVISGIEEARLVTDGISPARGAAKGSSVVIDIGGGSTEFISVRDEEVLDIVSTDLGVVRLTERFLGGDPPAEGEVARLLNFVEKGVDLVYNRFYGAGSPPHPRRLIGTAGTVTTLAAIDRGLVAYDPDVVEGYLLGLTSVARMLGEFLAIAARQRLVRYPVLTHGRQDVIVAGTLILKAAMERFGAAEVVVSDRGLLEGVVRGLLEDNGRG